MNKYRLCDTIVMQMRLWKIKSHTIESDKKVDELKHENHKLKIVYLAHSLHQFCACALPPLSWPPTTIRHEYTKTIVCCRCCCANELMLSHSLVHRQTSRQNHWSASKFKRIHPVYIFYLFDQVTIAINASSSSLLWCNRKLRNANATKKREKKTHTQKVSVRNGVDVSKGKIQNGYLAHRAYYACSNREKKKKCSSKARCNHRMIECWSIWFMPVLCAYMSVLCMWIVFYYSNKQHVT